MCNAIKALLRAKEGRELLLRLLDAGIVVGPGERAPAGLRAAVEAGIAREIDSFYVVCCPYCSSNDVFVRYYCPYCASPDMRKRVLITDLKCGCVFEADSDHELVCEGCGRKLVTREKDYRVVGVMFACCDCGKRTEMPVIAFLCRACGREFLVQDSLYVPFRRYALTEAANEIFYFIMSSLQALKNAVPEDATLTTFAPVAADQGALVFDAMIRLGDALIVVDCVPEVDAKVALKLLDKRAAIEPTCYIVLALRADEEARKCLEREQIRLLVGDPRTITSKLREFVGQCLREDARAG